MDSALDALGLGERGDLARLRQDWEELAAIVREQKQHLDEIARRTQELSSLSGFLQTHGEREKARLARELHDGLGGILTPARMDLSWLQERLGNDPQCAQRMSRLSALIDQGIDLKRRIIEELHPSLRLGGPGVTRLDAPAERLHLFEGPPHSAILKPACHARPSTRGQAP